MSIKLGKYKHYKGEKYEVLGEVLHTETREILVLYKALYEIKNSELGENPLFVRPKAMFLEKIKINNIEKSRFEFIGKK